MQVPKPISEALFRSTVLNLVRALWRPVLVDTPHFTPDGPCFVYGNHSNNLDPFVINLFQPWGKTTAGLMTMEQIRNPIAGPFLRAVDLYGTRKRVAEPHLIRTIYRLLERKKQIVIYPEGGRRWHGRPGAWMPATVKLFARAGVPVYPVLVHGSYVGWPRWATYPRPARLRVEWKAPLTFDRHTPYEEALRRLQAPIDFDENLVDDALKPKRAYRPADGIHKLLYRDPFTGAREGLFTPDGTYVENRAGTVRLRMLPDSTLLDERTGEVHTTGDLYERVLALPPEPDAEGRLLHDRVTLHEEVAFPELRPKGTAEATLFGDALRLRGEGVDETIPFEDVREWDVERNYKLQLTLRGRMLQLSFGAGQSALQWADTLRRLREPAVPAVEAP